MVIAGFESDDPTAGVFDSIERLGIGVHLRPVAPAILTVGGRDLRIHVEPVAMLEAEIAFVHGLETRPASQRDEQRREGL